VEPQDHAQQASLTIGGRRLSGDPGTVKYTAPYYIPEKLRAGLPRVLYTDPWPSMVDMELMQHHAQTCLHFLRTAAAGKPMSADQVHSQLNEQEVAAGHGPLLSSIAYTTSLLERLRSERLVAGSKNPASDLAPGYPNYPYLYHALPEQALHKKPPSVLAKMTAKRDAKAVDQALKRLRRGKSPYAIHRPVAQHSAFQYALAHEAVQAAMSKTKSVAVQEKQA